MSTTFVDIHWSPDPIVFGEAILEVDEALDHVEIPLAFAAAEVGADIRHRFDTETGPDGMPWQKWSPNYEPKALAFPNIGILQRTGEMADDATSDRAMIVSGDTLWFDWDALPDYAPWHQEGLPDRRTKAGIPNPLPARPFAGLSEETRAVIFAIFADWFDRAIQIYETRTGRLGRRHVVQGIHPLTGHAGFVPRSVPMPVRIR